MKESWKELARGAQATTTQGRPASPSTCRCALIYADVGGLTPLGGVHNRTERIGKGSVIKAGSPAATQTKKMNRTSTQWNRISRHLNGRQYVSRCRHVPIESCGTQQAGPGGTGWGSVTFLCRKWASARNGRLKRRAERGKAPENMGPWTSQMRCCGTVGIAPVYLV